MRIHHYIGVRHWLKTVFNKDWKKLSFKFEMPQFSLGYTKLLNTSLLCFQHLSNLTCKLCATELYNINYVTKSVG